MSNTLNTSTLYSEKQKLPFWLVVVLVVAVVFTLSTVAVYAYKQSQTNPNIAVKQSSLESRKHLLLLQSDVIDTNWLRTLNPLVKNVQGRLIWSTKMQQGIMEFENLPRLKKNQQYRLWVYDLIETRNEPISAAVFDNVAGETFLISFDTNPKVNSPFKFELVLQTEGEEADQPLLLAQP